VEETEYTKKDLQTVYVIETKLFSECMYNTCKRICEPYFLGFITELSESEIALKIGASLDYGIEVIIYLNEIFKSGKP